MKFRPCVDIYEGKVKQIVGSSLGGVVKTNFETSKSGEDFAEIFEKYDLKGGHICVLDRSEESFNLAKNITKSFKTWQIGGGINIENFARFLDNGADKVIISSGLFLGADVFEQATKLSRKIGKENLVFDLSCQSFNEKYFVMKDGWRTKTELIVNQENLEKLSQFCAEFLIHGVAVEGKKGGFDEDLVQILSDFAENSKTPITYAGGLSSLQNIKNFVKFSRGNLDFTVGSSLNIYGGDLDLEQICKICEK